MKRSISDINPLKEIGSVIDASLDLERIVSVLQTCFSVKSPVSPKTSNDILNALLCSAQSIVDLVSLQIAESVNEIYCQIPNDYWMVTLEYYHRSVVNDDALKLLPLRLVDSKWNRVVKESCRRVTIPQSLCRKGQCQKLKSRRLYTCSVFDDWQAFNIAFGKIQHAKSRF